LLSVVCPRVVRMTGTVVRDTLAGLAAEFAELVDRLQRVDLVPAADEVVVEFWREVEVQTRRLAAVDHRVIVDLERRGLAGLGAYASTAAMARDVLRIASGEATARVDAAHRLGPRWSPIRPVLPAQFPDTAAAIAEGEISARHAAVVTRAVDQLPDEVVDELGGWVRSHLLEQARVADPMLLARYATSLIDRLDQDGRYRELGHQQQRRQLRLVDRPDGSCRLEGYCTVEAAETAEQLRVFVDAMAAPHPAADGTADPRSAGQRRHDALRELVKLAMRTGQLPNAGAMTATIVLTMDARVE